MAEHIWVVVAAVPVFAGYVVIQYVVVGVGLRRARLPVPQRRAVLMSAMTRNSLVVLPLSYGLGEGYELAPVVVTTQTAVELVLLVVAVRAVPWLLPSMEEGQAMWPGAMAMAKMPTDPHVRYACASRPPASAGRTVSQAKELSSS